MKKIVSFAVILLSCLFVLSCNGKKDNGGNEGGTPQLSVLVKDAPEIFEIPKNQSQNVTLTVTADPTSAESYTITLGANAGLVASYNTAHGTDYQMLPSTAYSFTASQVMLPRYSAKSTAAEIRLKGEGVTEDQVYLLPVSIDGVQGGTNFQAPDDKAAYILFRMTAAQQQGSGTEADPYLLFEPDDIIGMDALLKDDATSYFKLAADIDLVGVTFTDDNPWIPINSAADAEDENAHATCRARKIVLDGNNHKISNFKAGGPLFGILCGSVKDLTLDGFLIDSDAADAATLIGVAGASGNPDDFVMKNVTVTNSKVMTQESDSGRAGGIVSRMRDGLIENCSSECVAEATKRAGGLLAYADKGTVKNCSASGDIKVVTYYGGGLIGVVLSATVTGCHATGNVTSEGGNYVRCGGLIGQIDGNATVTKCYATGNISGQGHMAGGLVGVVGADDITVNISECYATGSVTLPTGGNWAHAGGLLGTLAAPGKAGVPTVNISNCYSTGAITVRRYSGGFVGSVFSKPGNLNITNSYTTSDISGINLQTHCGIMIGCVDPVAGGSNVTASGFVAWGTGEFTICRYKKDDGTWTWGNNGTNAELVVPLNGNYCGTEGTVTSQAQKLGWDTSIWDFSADLPKLKNVQ